MRRRTKAICLLCLCAFCCAGCSGSHKKAGNRIKIGITLYDQYDTFIETMMESFMKYAAEKEEKTGVGITVEVCNAANSQTAQNEQVDNMIKNDFDVICVNLVDRTEPAIIIDQAQDSNTPVVFFNRELVAEDLERWDQLYYIGAEALVSGIMQGELGAEIFRSDPGYDRNGDGVCQYVVLEGEAGHQDSIMRTEYSVRTMEEQGIRLEKLSYAIANWNRAQAQTKMTQILAQYKEQLEMIIANNDDMALGAIDAYKEANIPKEYWPVIVGIDGTRVGLEAVKNGEMQGTVYNDADGQAKAMLDLCCSIVNGENLDKLNLKDGKYIRLPYEKISADDVDQYLE